MAVIAVSGEPGCRHEEVARLLAQQLRWEWVSPARLQRLFAETFGAESAIPDKAYRAALTTVMASLAAEHHYVLCAESGEFLNSSVGSVLRVRIVAPVSRRAGTLMLDDRLDRPAARAKLQELERAANELRKRRTGRATLTNDQFDVVLNAESLEPDQMAEALSAIAAVQHLPEQGLLTGSALAQVQFQTRLQLAKFGVSPQHDVSLSRRKFMHPSEEIFANLLDFYRIAWEYEPRSFPLQWDKSGRVIEAFTPDFYLPDFRLFIELTAMKQANVTKKNGKVKRVRELYPEVNIQVFYQKDLENLIFKYGLAERTVLS